MFRALSAGRKGAIYFLDAVAGITCRVPHDPRRHEALAQFVERPYIGLPPCARIGCILLASAGRTPIGLLTNPACQASPPLLSHPLRGVPMRSRVSWSPRLGRPVVLARPPLMLVVEGVLTGQLVRCVVDPDEERRFLVLG